MMFGLIIITVLLLIVLLIKKLFPTKAGKLVEALKKKLLWSPVFRS